MADTADTARIDDSKMIYTTELLEAAVQQKRIPGAVAAVGVGTETLWTTVVGIAEVSSLPRPVTPETVYDLASLTKVLATLPAILLLAERGSLLLSDRVADFFDDFRGGEKENVTLEHLLTHTSGLPHHRYVSSYGQTQADMIRGLCAEPLEMAPGSAVVYSDLGYILLGEVIERVSGQPLDVFAEREIFAPLGMHHTCFCPPPAWYTGIAATEMRPRQTQATLGVVHDRNAATLGGVAGHAGLFSRADDVARYLAVWTTRDASFLSPWTRERALRAYPAQPHAHRGLGWLLRHDSQDFFGDLWPPSCAGHTGFTGTSVAFDPESRLWVTLLTNRVHFGRETDIGRLRRTFHSAVAAAYVPSYAHAC